MENARRVPNSTARLAISLTSAISFATRAACGARVSSRTTPSIRWQYHSTRMPVAGSARKAMNVEMARAVLHVPLASSDTVGSCSARRAHIPLLQGELVAGHATFASKAISVAASLMMATSSVSNVPVTQPLICRDKGRHWTLRRASVAQVMLATAGAVTHAPRAVTKKPFL
jgi:hypothetical protein